MRLRENSEGVALIRGEADEERGLKRAFGRVIGVMKDLIRAERQPDVADLAYGMLADGVPDPGRLARATSPARSPWAC